MNIRIGSNIDGLAHLSAFGINREDVLYVEGRFIPRKDKKGHEEAQFDGSPYVIHDHCQYNVLPANCGTTCSCKCDRGLFIYEYHELFPEVNDEGYVTVKFAGEEQKEVGEYDAVISIAKKGTQKVVSISVEHVFFLSEDGEKQDTTILLIEPTPSSAENFINLTWKGLKGLPSDSESLTEYINTFFGYTPEQELEDGEISTYKDAIDYIMSHTNTAITPVQAGQPVFESPTFVTTRDFGFMKAGKEIVQNQTTLEEILYQILCGTPEVRYKNPTISIVGNVSIDRYNGMSSIDDEVVLCIRQNDAGELQKIGCNIHGEGGYENYVSFTDSQIKYDENNNIHLSMPLLIDAITYDKKYGITFKATFVQGNSESNEATATYSVNVKDMPSERFVFVGCLGEDDDLDPAKITSLYSFEYNTDTDGVYTESIGLNYGSLIIVAAPIGIEVDKINMGTGSDVKNSMLKQLISLIVDGESIPYTVYYKDTDAAGNFSMDLTVYKTI